MTLYALDVEANGLDIDHGCRPFSVAMLGDNGDKFSWNWNVDPYTREVDVKKSDVKEIREILIDRDNEFVLHNCKYDYRALQAIGTLNFIDHGIWNRTHDTMMLAHLHNSSSTAKLKDLASLRLDINNEDQEKLRKATNAARDYGRRYDFLIAQPHLPHCPGMTSEPKDGWWVMDMFLPREMARHANLPKDDPNWTVCQNYNNIDVLRTLRLKWYYESFLEENPHLLPLYRKRMQMCRITYKMESTGAPINLKWLDIESKKFAAQAKDAQEQLFSLANNKINNVNSPKQVSMVLFGALKFPPTKQTDSGGYSTSVDDLEPMIQQATTEEQKTPPYVFARQLISYRKCSKAVDYLKSYKSYAFPCGNDYAILKPHYKIWTSTTRLASYDPNAQNVSKKEDFNLRAIFGPQPGDTWYSADYDNIELRIFAYEAGDKQLIKAFEDGFSVHIIIAKVLWPKELEELGIDAFKETDKYRWVKNGNFSLLYGATEAKADRTYRKPGAYALIKKKLPLIGEFMAQKAAEARRTGKVLTKSGYPLHIPRGKVHVPVNYFVQGTAGIAIMNAMIRVDQYIRNNPEDNIRMIFTIHDELDFLIPSHIPERKHIPNIVKLMERSTEDIGVPMKVECKRVDCNWSQSSKLSLAT